MPGIIFIPADLGSNYGIFILKNALKDLYEDSAEVSEIKQLSINGLDAFRIDIVMEAFDYLEKKVIVLFMKGETLFEVNGICLADDKEGADEIEDILKSLRID